MRGRNISLYADDQIRLAFSRAVAIESARGWRIGKEHQVHKIDVVVATAMAALACVRGQAKGRMRMALSSGDGCGPFVEVDPATLLPLAPRSHVVRGADGLVHLISDNTGRQGTD